MVAMLQIVTLDDSNFQDHEIITPLEPLPLLLEVAFAVVKSGSHNFDWFMCQRLCEQYLYHKNFLITNIST